MTDAMGEVGPEFKELTQDELQDLLGDPEPTPTQPSPEAPAEPETPAAEAAPETGGPQGTETEEQPTPEGTPGETPTDQPPWAGRYETPEEVWKALQHAQGKISQTGAERNHLRGENAQLRGILQRVAPIVQRMGQAPQGTEFDPDTPGTVEPLVDARIAAYEQQRFAQDQAAREQSEAQEAIDAFKASHETDLTPEVEEQLTGVMREFDAFPETDTLEAAHEAARDPALLKVLRANPDWLFSDEGMEIARAQATILKQAQAPQGGETPGAPKAPAASKPPVPVVETGNSGPPAPPKPKDEVDEILEFSKSQNRTGYGF